MSPATACPFRNAPPQVVAISPAQASPAKQLFPFDMDIEVNKRPVTLDTSLLAVSVGLKICFP